MIKAKEFEALIIDTSVNLRNIHNDSLNGEDLKLICERVKSQCYSLLEITLKFQGQEEGIVEIYKEQKKLLYSDSILNWGIK